MQMDAHARFLKAMNVCDRAPDPGFSARPLGGKSRKIDSAATGAVYVPVPSSCERRIRMEWKIIALNFTYAVLGVVLMYVSYRVIDWLTPQVEFAVELKKGNVAVAIFISAIFLSIAIIIGGSLN
jgi:hypothetical protein